MATREQRTILLDVISATDIKKVKSLHKQDAYALAYVSTSPGDWKTTKTDTYGNLNPVWNSKLTLTVDEELRRQNLADIILEVHCQSDSESSTLLGEAKIPLSNLPEESSTIPSLTFDLLRPSGKSQGIVTVALKLGEKKTIQGQNQVQVQQRDGPGNSSDVPVTAYPATPAYNPGSQLPQQAYGYPPQQAYGYPPQQAYGYPPQQAYGYPPQQAYGFSQQPPYGSAPYPYGYAPPPPPYGYAPPPPPPVYPQQAPPSRFGGGLGGGLGGAGLGLGAGLLGGFLVGDALGNLGGNDTYVDNNYYGDNGGGDDGGGGDYGGGDDGGGDS